MLSNLYYYNLNLANCIIKFSSNLSNFDAKIRNKFNPLIKKEFSDDFATGCTRDLLILAFNFILF